MKSPRTKMAALVVAASTLGGILHFEGIRQEAYIPVPGDVPTIGVGATHYEDGTKVKMGDKISKERAMVLLKNHADDYADKAVRKCSPVPMHQYEFDVYVGFAINVGPTAYCNSTLVKKLNQYDYEGACAELLRWNMFKGRVLPGLDNRRKQEYKLCLGQ